MNESQVRQQLSAISVTIWERGWVANHDGNLSTRLPRKRLMCTPTAVSKREILPNHMLVLDETGKHMSGKGKPFSEINLHLAFYHARADVGAVLHAHPPTATALGVSGVAALERPFLPEAVVSIGPMVPTVPLAMPGTEAVQALAPYLDEFDALLLAGNGVITAGKDMEMAFLRMELVEHMAKIALAAHQLGGPSSLPPRFLGALLAARARAGLGPEARGGATTQPQSEPTPKATRDLDRVVKQEIERVLKNR